ncbi:glycosyltransferase family 4 protein [Gloeothece verrucosa]|uniref:Glycosyl transferase group 1 n=1 Tax=Gloeothece verrucosa (strain PCC 7822) TaxID=497965 RepID=E0U7F0_GLOV7|nr:glycosyltransferase family 4 protein [Gloeothece verrucosa]ADN13646.1 glycosyl transferase group 1 [Gloeothece verrucosa PCC 7822]
MRILILQYAGDYGETVKLLAAGGDETYYAQKYSVDAVAEIAKKVDEVTTLCCLTEKPYNEMLDNGVRAIGMGFSDQFSTKELLKKIEEYQPTHLIVRMPDRATVDWAIKRRVKTILTLADSFSPKGLRNKIRNFQLANLLNNKQIDWIGNHGISASLSLRDIGVNPNKIIPWDWPSTTTPNSFAPKTLPSEQKTWDILYVGAINEAKGIGDAIEAISILKSKGLSIRLKVAGKGPIESFLIQAKRLEVEKEVKFLGLLPHKTIIPLMNEADVVLVPSRHEYPEGFPMTIYEALCSRTPIVASDHPMFCKNLSHQTNALIFPAGDSRRLAICIEKLLSAPELYENLSLASYETWKNLQLPVKWAELINRWLFDSPENQQWLFEHRLSSGKYRE